MGPVQFLVIGFEGDRFTGEIMPEIDKLRGRDIIRILDLAFVRRDENGTITSIELSDLPAGEADKLSGVGDSAGDWLSEEDIRSIGAELPDSTAVALVLFEHVWAQSVHEAIGRANGSLLAEGMVPRDLINAVEERFVLHRAA